MTIRTYRFPSIDRIVHGAGAVERVPALVDELGRRRAFVVTNHSLAAGTPLVADLEAALGARWVGTFPRMRAHVPADDVAEATDAARAAGADLLVGFGGSSVTDATKIVSARLDHPPQVAIPTTLSAGEHTPASGMTGEVEGVKTYLADPRMMPTVIVLDPAVTLRTPADLWAATGVKALDHACEALWGPRSHPFADALALEAIRRLHASLPRSLHVPDDLDARLDCQLAAWMSMAGVVNVGVYLSHTLGHQIGARWDVPHGVTSCLTLVPVMRFLADRGIGLDAQADIADALGCPSPAAAANALEAFIAHLPVPTRLRDVGADRDDVDHVAAATLVAMHSLGADAPAAHDDLVALLDAMW